MERGIGGTPIQHPELHDRVWLEAHEHLGADGIAKLLGSHPQYVKRCMVAMGMDMGTCYFWTDVENELMDRFYAESLVRYLEAGLARRNHDAIYHWGRDRGVPKLRYGKGARTPEREWDFWADWRVYILAHLRRWMSNGGREVALQLTWKPAQPPGVHVKCSGCEVKAGCGHNVNPLPCERVTVENMLRGRGE